jgi:hypothetical protein
MRAQKLTVVAAVTFVPPLAVAVGRHRNAAIARRGGGVGGWAGLMGV